MRLSKSTIAASKAINRTLKRREAKVGRLRLIGRADPLAAPLLAQGTNALEATFAARALEKRWKVARSGWPDFLCELPDGSCIAVEVKANVNDRPRPNQRRMFKVLERCGIPVRVWSPDQPDKLRDWRNMDKSRRSASWAGSAL